MLVWILYHDEYRKYSDRINELIVEAVFFQARNHARNFIVPFVDCLTSILVTRFILQGVSKQRDEVVLLATPEQTAIEHSDPDTINSEAIRMSFCSAASHLTTPSVIFTPEPSRSSPVKYSIVRRTATHIEKEPMAGFRVRHKGAEDDEATLASFDTNRLRDFNATSERQGLPIGLPWPSHASHEQLSVDSEQPWGRPNVRELERTQLDFSFLDPEGGVAARLRCGWLGETWRVM
ncbi:hypothetical protein GGX14DRAFT_547159 [Mycena pura]|uniref:Uncharacterized protein n=1 Tax=Mycena pura TaxID=153505 RepID=A0AAD6Y2S7_9AGAR|nr:hypothetical protein GGX14DRAFT_547159 [Mycena pura]